MSQKLLVNKFRWIGNTSQFNWDFKKDYKEESDEEYFRQVDAEYPKKIQELHNDLPFLPEKMKIEKSEKLVINLHNKTEYVIHITILKEALNHGLIFKRV